MKEINLLALIVLTIFTMSCDSDDTSTFTEYEFINVELQGEENAKFIVNEITALRKNISNSHTFDAKYSVNSTSEDSNVLSVTFNLIVEEEDGSAEEKVLLSTIETFNFKNNEDIFYGRTDLNIKFLEAIILNSDDKTTIYRLSSTKKEIEM